MKVINIQPIERKAIGNGSALDVHSIFHTIQGEGPHTGRPAVFIRLAGCNLQCPACDTDYTSYRKIVDTNILVSEVKLLAPPTRAMVVITGGEPFRQNLSLLVRRLHDSGYEVQIETNGTLAPVEFPWGQAYIVCSPKAGKVHKDLRDVIDCYKYVVAAGEIDPRDGLPLRALDGVRPARPHEGFAGRVYVNPQDDKELIQNSANVKAALDVAMQFGYTFGLQVHKLVNME